jgi:hypothetical protein
VSNFGNGIAVRWSTRQTETDTKSDSGPLSNGKGVDSGCVAWSRTKSSQAPSVFALSLLGSPSPCARVCLHDTSWVCTNKRGLCRAGRSLPFEPAHAAPPRAAIAHSSSPPEPSPLRHPRRGGRKDSRKCIVQAQCQVAHLGHGDQYRHQRSRFSN